VKFFLATVALALVVPYTAQASPYWLSVSSFRSIDHAQRYLQNHEESFSRGLRIQHSQVGSEDFYRVLTGPFAQEQDARDQMASLRATGYGETWLVADVPQNVATRSAPTSAQQPRRQGPLGSAAPSSAVSTDRVNVDEDNPADVGVPETILAELVAGEPIRLTKFDRRVHKIKIDGVVDESVWQSVPVIDDYKVVRPDTLEPGNHATQMRMTYSDDGFYISSVMEQPSETIIRRLTGRDMFFMVNQENFGVMLDTSGDSKYGYFFGVTSSGSIMDGTMLPERRMSPDWDGAVHARSSLTSTGWSAEIFVPWGILSMPASGDVRTLKVATIRKVAYKEEEWGWPPLLSTNSRFMSLMQPIEVENIAPRQQWSVYPFLSSAYDWVDEKADVRPGADVFWRPSSNFQLNATLNPDFGNVESDAVVLNLTATETFFPEKRLFFLEGQEVFNATPRADTRSSGVGDGGLPYTMVNTRRIGGKPRPPQVSNDTVVPQRELVQRTELLGALKTTGQLGAFRYGLMGAFEDDLKFDVIGPGGPQNLRQDGNNYGVARLLYETSRAGDYRALGVLSTAVLNSQRDALVQGVDWHYRTASGRVKIDGQYMTSDIEDVQTRGHGGFLDFEFTYRQGLVHRIGLEYFDENIDINDLGFLQRNNEYRLRTALSWTSSSMQWARNNQFDIRGFAQKSVTESLFNGGGLFLSNRTSLNNLSQLTARLGYFPSTYDDLNSFGNGTFRVDDQIDGGLYWDSDTTKVWQYGLFANYKTEQVDEGDGYTVGARLTWKPSYQFSVDLGLRYTARDGWLLHQGGDQMGTYESRQWVPNLSIEYYFNAQQQLKLGVSWVGIKANEEDVYRIPGEPGSLIPIAKPAGQPSYDFSVSQYSLQVRYRWEIAPLSDIYLVYTRQADDRSLWEDSGFDRIFDNAWRDPLEDIFVFKIRYRFGS